MVVVPIVGVVNATPVPKDAPPEAAAYQLTVPLPAADKLYVAGPGPEAPVAVGLGEAKTDITVGAAVQF